MDPVTQNHLHAYKHAYKLPLVPPVFVRLHVPNSMPLFLFLVSSFLSI